MKYLSIDELKTLLRSIPQDKPDQHTMFLVMYWHGLRVSEVVGPKGLRGKSIQHGYVDVYRLKGSEHTIQPYVVSDDHELDESVALTALANRTGMDELVFRGLSVRGVQKLMERISAKTGLNRKRMHPHALKHTCAMHGIQAGNGIEVMRSVLGHKSLSSTGFYTRIAQDDAMRQFAASRGGRI
jgi:site-specific recombinase XerD